MNSFNKKSISEGDLIPVILSGGRGSRLWPLSRASFPKQYLNLEEEHNFSLIQNTYLRLRGLDNLKGGTKIFSSRTNEGYKCQAKFNYFRAFW